MKTLKEQLNESIEGSPIPGRFYECIENCTSQVLNAPGKTFDVKKGWFIIVKSFVPSNNRVRFLMHKPKLEQEILDIIQDAEDNHSGLYVTLNQFNKCFKFNNVMSLHPNLGQYPIVQ